MHRSFARVAICLLALAISIAAPLSSAHAKRVALVIGIDAYAHLSKLEKAVNDARAVASVLKSDLAFDTVITGENLTRSQMVRKLAELDGAVQPGDTVLFFFSGHGVALSTSENILLPADIAKPGLGQEGLVRDDGFPVDGIIRRIQQRGALVSLMILDACRDNPFEQVGVRSIGATRGLARIEAPQGVFVLFSAGLGQKALDRLPGTDPAQTSVFTRHLVPLLGMPGLSLSRLAKQVQSDVSATALKVGHEQLPAYYDQVAAEVVLKEGPRIASAASPTPPASAPTPIPAPVPAVRPPSPSVPAAGQKVGKLEKSEPLQTPPTALDTSIKLPAVAPGAWAGRRLEPEVGHTSNITSIVVSPDRQWIASASSDNTIKVWDAKRGRLLRTLEGHTDGVSSIAVSSDARWIVSGSRDSTVKVWEAATGRLQHTLQGGYRNDRAGGIVRSIAVSPDGRWIAASYLGASINVWSAESGWLLRPIKEELLALNDSIAVSADGWVVAGGRPSIKVWEIATGRVLRTLEGQEGTIALSHDARRLVLNSGEVTTVWDTASGRQLSSIADGGALSAISPDGTWVAVGSDGRSSKMIRVFDAATGLLLRTVGEGSVFAFSSDGGWIVAIEGETLRVWDAATGRLLRSFKVEADGVGGLNSLALWPDGRSVVSSDGNAVRVWDATTGRPQRTISGGAGSVTVSPDGRWFASQSKSKIDVTETTTGRHLQTITINTPSAIEASSDGRAVITTYRARHKGRAHLRWDLATGARSDTTAEEKLLLSALAADGSKLDPVGTARAGSAILLLAPNGTTRARLTVLPDGHWVAIGADGLTYTGSEGVEARLLLPTRRGFFTESLSPAFIAAHRRPSLDLGPTPRPQ